MAKVHIIGAGLAGMAAAIALGGSGREVAIYERQREAGGRVRTLIDGQFGAPIDNGIHLAFSGQRGLRWFLQATAAEDRLTGPTEACFEFLDLADECRWQLRPNKGLLPWWILARGRRTPGTGFADVLGLIRLALAPSHATVASCLGEHRVSVRRLWEPFTVAALNTPPHSASARELWRTWRRNILWRGADRLRVRFARRSLSDSLIEPALHRLQRHGVALRLGTGVEGFVCSDGRVDRIHVAGEAVGLAADDAIIAAVPPSRLARLLPELPLPRRESAIITAHFRLPPPYDGGGAAVPPRLICLLDSRSEWLLQRGGVASLTVGAADDLIELPDDQLCQRFWQHVQSALSLPPLPMPTARLIKERAGTYAHTPEQCENRRQLVSPYANLHLAGDWTSTETPATMDGAIHSGLAAAHRVLGVRGGEP